MNLDFFKEEGRAGGRLWVGAWLSGPSEEVAAEIGEHECQQRWSPCGSVDCQVGSGQQKAPR